MGRFSWFFTYFSFFYLFFVFFLLFCCTRAKEKAMENTKNKRKIKILCCSQGFSLFFYLFFLMFSYFSLFFCCFFCTRAKKKKLGETKNTQKKKHDFQGLLAFLLIFPYVFLFFSFC